MADQSSSETTVILQFLTGRRKGESFSLDREGRYRLGRDPGCEIHIPESNVSRVHALLVWDGAILTVEDLKSTNGILLNGERVQVQKIEPNDVVAVGSCVFRVDKTAREEGGTEVVVSQGDRRPRPDTTLIQRVGTDQFQRLFESMLGIQRILSVDAPDMIEQSLRTLFLTLPVTRLCLMKVTGQGESFEPWIALSVEESSAEVAMSKTFARKVLQADKGIVIQDARYLDSAEWGSTMQQQEVRSILGVPVRHRGEPIAVLLCDNLEKPNILKEVHARTLTFFARSLETVFQRDELRVLEESQAQTERAFLAAGRVQRQIFTKKPPSRIGVMHWAFEFVPALEVGGDFYDFYEKDGEITWIVADVAGKGIPAALVVSMLKGFCKMLFPKHLTPLETMRELNYLLHGELPPDMFLTAIILRVSPSGQITYCNAGHPPALIISHKGRESAVTRLKNCGVPLGVLDPDDFSVRFSQYTVPIHQGDRLCAYTDGVTEVFNSSEQLFGEEGVRRAILESSDIPIEEVVQHIRGSIRDFSVSDLQDDDITILLGEYSA